MLTCNILLLLLVSFAYGQNRAIDSLKRLLKKDKADTTKIIHLNDLAWEIMYVQPDSAIKLSKQALSLAKSVKFVEGIALSTGQLGTFQWIKGDYPLALRHFFKAVAIYEKLGMEHKAAAILGNVGTIYLDQKDVDKAISYYLKALKIVEAHADEASASAILGSLGNAYAEKGDYDKALDYFLKGLSISERQGDKNKIATDLSNIGSIYSARGDYQKALDFNFKSLALVQELGNNLAIARNLGNIGSLYTIQKKYAAAEKYLTSALALYKETGYQNEEWQFELAISDLYTQTQRSKLALEHYKRAMVVKDSLFSAEKSQEIIRREMSYEFEKKERSVRAERDKKNALAKAEIKRKEQQRNYFLGGFVLILIIALFILRSYRQKKQANELIAQQKLAVERKNEEIEEKNKEILDSIRYAKRIQLALLPSKKFIDKTLTHLQNK